MEATRCHQPLKKYIIGLHMGAHIGKIIKLWNTFHHDIALCLKVTWRDVGIGEFQFIGSKNGEQCGQKVCTKSSQIFEKPKDLHQNNF